MVAIPLGAQVNLAIQLVALVLILVGLRYASQTHELYKSAKEGDAEKGAKSEGVHKNLMTGAVVVSGVGTLIWMAPNFFMGWFYTHTGLDFGTGGYGSYLTLAGNYYAHWFLIPLMVVLGSATAVLGVYLVLRMRWSGFPKSLAVANYRAVMIATWSMWVLNAAIGMAVFFFYVLTGTG